MTFPPKMTAAFILILICAATPSAKEGTYVIGGGATKSDRPGGQKFNVNGAVGGLFMDRYGFEFDVAETISFYGHNLTEFTASANFLLVGPWYRSVVRPFGSTGLGLLRSNTGGPNKFEDLGLNIGGGVMYFPTRHPVGLRADLRYFRALTDNVPNPGTFDFWRWSLGIALRLR